MKLTGGQAIVKMLEREQIPYILGIPGHGVLSLFDAIRQSHEEGKLRYIQVKHEQAATHIADGYYRMSGKPLATLSSIGPGSLNTAIGLATAYVDSSAMISFCGDTHVRMKGVGVLQEIERYQDSNFLRALEPLTKRSWRVESAGQLPRVLNRAFLQMRSGRPGPVAVAVPMDVQADEVELVMEDTAVPAPETMACPNHETIDKALELMKSAKRPVLLVGGGALRARAAEKLVKLAEQWNAAVVTTLAAKSAFPEDHPLYGFHTGSKGTPVGLELCRKADVILALGVRFADETTCSYRKGASFNFPDTKLIHVDLNAEEINKNYRADVGIVGDLRAVLDALNERFGEVQARKDYVNEIAALKADWQKVIERRRTDTNGEFTISQMIGVMNRVLPRETIISSSSGNSQAQLFQEYCFAEPYTNLTTGGFSTMGWAFPAAMGAKLACPDRPVVALVGDGDFLMTMQELSTMAQYDIPVVIVLADNRGWFAIQDLQVDAYGKDYAFGNEWTRGGESYTPDYCAIAEAFGIKAWRAGDQDAFGKALKEAMASGKPALVTADVSRVYPYTGGEAYGWWDVPVPGYIEDRSAAYLAAREEERPTM